MDLISSADSWPPLLQSTYPRDPANPPTAIPYTISPAPTHPWVASLFPECAHVFSPSKGGRPLVPEGISSSLGHLTAPVSPKVKPELSLRACLSLGEFPV